MTRQRSERARAIMCSWCSAVAARTSLGGGSGTVVEAAQRGREGVAHRAPLVLRQIAKPSHVAIVPNLDNRTQACAQLQVLGHAIAEQRAGALALGQDAVQGILGQSRLDADRPIGGGPPEAPEQLQI